MKKIVAGYIRVSTEMQAERDSLTNQEEIITNFVKRQSNGLKIYKDAVYQLRIRTDRHFRRCLPISGRG